MRVPALMLLSDIPRGEKVLLHICCAPDASYGVRALGELFDVTGFFYNPNIHPAEEYLKRVQATLDLPEEGAVSADRGKRRGNGLGRSRPWTGGGARAGPPLRGVRPVPPAGDGEESPRSWGSRISARS